jgi:predicted nuclease of predicted toxin-antitoxin system
MNVPRQLGRQLTNQGHLCRHVGDIGMARAQDTAIIEEAKRNQEVIVTHDLDYSHLLAFSGESKPSVIIFRLRNTNPNNLFDRIMKIWPEIQQPLLNGSIVVVEDAVARIRNLPIRRKYDLG